MKFAGFTKPILSNVFANLTCHQGRKVTYGSFVVDFKEHKEERERTILTAGGDQIEYPGDKSTHTAGLTTEKSLSTASFQQKEQDSCWWI
jgi:hypothetical protein